MSRATASTTTGCFLAVFDVSRFRDPESFTREVDEFVDFLRDTAPAAGFTEVSYPCEVEWRTDARRRVAGIPEEESTWQALRDLAERLGVAVQDLNQ